MKILQAIFSVGHTRSSTEMVVLRDIAYYEVSIRQQLRVPIIALGESMQAVSTHFLPALEMLLL